jgi:hypothetical protein
VRIACVAALRNALLQKVCAGLLAENRHVTVCTCTAPVSRLRFQRPAVLQIFGTRDDLILSAYLELVFRLGTTCLVNHDHTFARPQGLPHPWERARCSLGDCCMSSHPQTFSPLV